MCVLGALFACPGGLGWGALPSAWTYCALHLRWALGAHVGLVLSRAPKQRAQLEGGAFGQAWGVGGWEGARGGGGGQQAVLLAWEARRLPFACRQLPGSEMTQGGRRSHSAQSWGLGGWGRGSSSRGPVRGKQLQNTNVRLKCKAVS